MTRASPARQVVDIRPQPGPQEAFLASQADIAIYGGAAGGGKTWALLLEPIRNLDNPEFAAVFFRRTTVQIRNPGALWDESCKLYAPAGLTPARHELMWRHPSGAQIKFAHLEHEKNVYDWQGAQLPLICFDELTHFTQGQFWYLVSRGRSMSGVAPYIRATCNPDVDSWVAEFIAWWIDPETGLPIIERGGMLRWFVRFNEELVWADTREELIARFGEDLPPKSVTFIPASLTDNQALMRANPEYRASLLALPRVERERLLGGNWKVRASAGLLFQRAWCQVVDAVPAGLQIIRGWDLAATPKTPENDPDWTTGTKIGKSADGRFFILDHRWARETPAGVERLILNTASQDGREVAVALPQDPGQAGKAQVTNLVTKLAGYGVRHSPVTGDKEVRFRPFSAQAEVGNILVLRGPWNDRWFDQLEGFPELTHDDDVDSTSEAFNAFLDAVQPTRQTNIPRMGR